MENTKISVIMGIYNCADTLPAAIDSILAQTYTNWEFIICDDASTDDSYEVARRYQEKYPEKFILLRNETNYKLAYSLNRCLEAATGYYVARMDGDDLCVPERFEKQVRYLREHPEVQLVGSAMQWFDDVNGPNKILYKPEHTDRWTLRRAVPFNHATILTYKNVYDQLGYYIVEERTSRGQDYDLWFRFFAFGFCGDNIQEALYLVREDINAIKRRTFRTRWSTFQTTVYGYKLLNYPKVWLIMAFFKTAVKSVTPYRIQHLYREIKRNRD